MFAGMYLVINKGSVHDLLSIRTEDVKDHYSQAGSVQLLLAMTNVRNCSNAGLVKSCHVSGGAPSNHHCNAW